MISTGILANIFSETIKQAIFYVFNLLNRSEGVESMSKKADKEFHDIEVQRGVEEAIQTDSDADHKYSLRERKAIIYRS